MKLYCGLLVVFIIITAGHAVRSQTAPPFAGAKVAVLSSGTFYDEKAGITRLVNAVKALEAEFKPRQDELIALDAKLRNLAKEIEQLAKLSDRSTINTKTDEAERLQLDIKRKQEDAKQAYERRSKVVIEPISNDIGKAIDVYAKTRGIDLILDLSKLAEAGAILALNATVDVTDAFIKDYNAKNSGVPVK